MHNEKEEIPKESSSALLSTTEREWLLGNMHVSKSFEYKMKNSIRRKVQKLFALDIPFLDKSDFISFNDNDKEESLARTEST
jgi:hypothetical protein